MIDRIGISMFVMLSLSAVSPKTAVAGDDEVKQMHDKAVAVAEAELARTQPEYDAVNQGLERGQEDLKLLNRAVSRFRESIQLKDSIPRVGNPGDWPTPTGELFGTVKKLFSPFEGTGHESFALEDKIIPERIARIASAFSQMDSLMLRSLVSGQLPPRADVLEAAARMSSIFFDAAKPQRTLWDLYKHGVDLTPPSAESPEVKVPTDPREIQILLAEADDLRNRATNYLRIFVEGGNGRPGIPLGIPSLQEPAAKIQQQLDYRSAWLEAALAMAGVSHKEEGNQERWSVPAARFKAVSAEVSRLQVRKSEIEAARAPWEMGRNIAGLLNACIVRFNELAGKPTPNVPK